MCIFETHPSGNLRSGHIRRGTGQRVRYLFVMCIAIRRGLASVIVIASVHTLIMNRTIRISRSFIRRMGFVDEEVIVDCFERIKSPRKGVILITGGYAQLESD